MATYPHDETEFQRIAQLIGSAALDRNRWRTALDALSNYGGGIWTHLFGYGTSCDTPFGVTCGLYVDEYVSTYKSYFHSISPWTPGVAGACVGVPTEVESHCPRARLLKTEYYADWIKPQEDIGAGAGLLVHSSDGRFFALGGSIRFRDEEMLQAQWTQTLSLLWPHLRRAFDVSCALHGATLREAALAHALEFEQRAILVVTARRRIQYANARAQVLVADGAVIANDLSGRLHSPDERAQTFIDCAFALLQSPLTETVPSFVIQSQDGAQCYSCNVVPFDPRHHAVNPLGDISDLADRCLLVILNKLPSDADKAAILNHNWQLTASEADVALSLADGRSAREIATRRSVSTHTVRNQIRATLAKCAVHRQGELISLVQNAIRAQH